MVKKQKQNIPPFNFIDLFAGLGGFHRALSALGGRCVFASELREDLRKLYAINFPEMRGRTETGINKIEGDITAVHPQDIPAHDILCAGFPCQPFSQAGKRQGFNDEKERGNLFYNICEIIDQHRPRFVFLENVANLKGHDDGNTWSTIKAALEERRYIVKDALLSPHQFGIPQHRRRIYIVCENMDYGELKGFEFPQAKEVKCNINDIIDYDETNYQHLKVDTRHQLDVWRDFLNLCIKHDVNVPTFPIWAMEFGATYDYEDGNTPNCCSLAELQAAKGTLGGVIKGKTRKECLACIPPYSRSDVDKFPAWKKKYIRQNRDFYTAHHEWLDPWKEQIRNFAPSHQKMEWNCGNVHANLDDKIIQFRASGIRVKLPTFSPALNLVGTQVPILPWIELPEKTRLNGETRGRYMTVHEASKLQGMQDLHFANEQFELPISRCYEALGNAVNVTIVELIAERMLNR
ncbi:MAG: DNA (cytosine-5-)-methyltransferase [Parabacteroides sp.]|nr:DNA (cytosine-5-)-methyltransferase [Parabacteroides sp.]